jgi:hypothetical protein
MKTIAKLKVQAIFTFVSDPQVIVDQEVTVPTRAGAGDLMDIELDVLEQILGDAIPDLVKISLCYTHPPRAMDAGMQQVFDYLVREPRRAKYYFQPDQREGVEKALMARMPGLASETPRMFA